MKQGWKQNPRDYKLIKCRHCGRVFKCLGPLRGKPDDCWAWKDASRTKPLEDRCLCPKCLDDFHDICRFGGYVDSYVADIRCYNCDYRFTFEGEMEEIVELKCPRCGSPNIAIMSFLKGEKQ